MGRIAHEASVHAVRAILAEKRALEGRSSATRKTSSLRRCASAAASLTDAMGRRSVAELKTCVEVLGLEAIWTVTAAAAQYRETLTNRTRTQGWGSHCTALDSGPDGFRTGT